MSTDPSLPAPKLGDVVICIEEALAQRQPAIVCLVGPPVPNGQPTLNVGVFREDGGHYGRTSVPHYFEGCGLGWLHREEDLPEWIAP
jgi:hypothetical protein